MKFLVYGGVVLLVIPFQTVIIHQFSIRGIIPDAVLLTVCLVGWWRGEMEAVVLGLALGFLQDLVSGATVWLNLMIKPLIGLVGGMLGHMLRALTPWAFPLFIMGISLFSGVLVLVLLQTQSSEMDVGKILLGTVLPQALYDGVFGAIIVLVIFHLFPGVQRRVWNP